ncbi:hypothetical protein PCANC_06172 [Puccinia coronata f. sp. avenae]|uniref:Uncharacterized protein n=1 Tax=Puccinia coronata f. sp. avenae TaxID=200324 RepID=A0A2N5VTI3_9BASI|nr:hypothetical protein PCANC_06172 [Puccinia coronata f. sp. avenae]
MSGRHTCSPSWCTPAWRAGTPARRAGVHQHGGQAHLLAELVAELVYGEPVCLPHMLVFTSSASRCACPPVGLVSVDASTDNSQHGGQAHLLAELVFTSSASRCACPPVGLVSVDASTDTSQHGVHQHGGQAHLLAELVFTSSASRCAFPPVGLVSVDASTDTSPWPHLLAKCR